MQLSVRGALPAQAIEITDLCLFWESGMRKIFSLFVKIPIHVVEDLFPIREGLVRSTGKEFREGRAAWEKIEERECL